MKEIKEDTTEINTKSKSISPIAMKCIIAAIVLAAMATAVFLLWKPIMGILGYPMGFDSPCEHFVYAEGKALDKLNDSVTSLYGKTLSIGGQTEFSAEGECHLRLGKEVLLLLADYLETESYSDVAWLDDIMLKIDLTSDSKRSKSNLTLGLNDTSVLGAEIIMDTESDSLMAAVPDLNKTFINLNTDEYAALVTDIKNILTSFPAEQKINEMIDRYVRLMLSQITQVESREVSLSAGHITQDCTALTATIDEATLNKIMIALFTEARDDEILRDTVKCILRLSTEEIPADFETRWVESIERAITQANDAFNQSAAENYFLLTDYLDSRHNIIGRRITVSENDEIYYLFLNDGKEFAFESDLMDIFALNGAGTLEKVLSGEFVFETEGVQVASVLLEDWDLLKLSRGQLEGTVRIIPSGEAAQQLYDADISDQFELELIMHADNTTQDCSFNLLTNQKLLAGVTAKIARKDYAEIKVPNYFIDATDEAALMQWMQELQYDKIRKNLKNAGASQYWLDMFDLITDAA